MTAARIVLKHRGMVLLDLPATALLRLMRFNGDIGEQYMRIVPDSSTVVETHTDQYVQCDKWIIEDSDGGAG